jgi:FkbM family methyltransferase
MLEQIIKDSKKILDIGANVGQSFLKFKVLNPEAKILSIEANPACEDALIECGADYMICALGDEKKTVEFFVNKNEPTCQGASAFKECTSFYSEGNYNTISMETIRLDDLLGDCVFDFIKIDTQGSEMSIIKGGESVIEKAKWVLLEVPVIDYNSGAAKAADIIKKMMTLGFLPHEVIKTNTVSLTDIIIQADILFKKNEDAKKIKTIIGEKIKTILLYFRWFKPNYYVEIGCYRLGTAIDVMFESHAEAHFLLDLFDKAPTHEGAPKERSLTLSEAKSIIEDCGAFLKSSVYLLQGYSSSTLLDVVNKINSADKKLFVFVDGGHSFETTLTDLKNCLLFDGEVLIIVDDFKWSNIRAAVIGFFDIATINGRAPIFAEGVDENLCVINLPAVFNKSKA